MLKKTLLFTFNIALAFYSISQTIDFPVWTVKSHENLDIEKIELKKDVTIIHLIVMSEIDDGAWFCADKNISILSAKNKFKSDIIKSENIPVCPDKHIFSSKGEVLRFSLFFPPIPENITRIDLSENCTNACFFFKDIVLDPALNSEIITFEKSVTDYSNGDFPEAIKGFEQIVNSCKDKESYRYGHSFSILPILYEETNQITKAENTYREILSSILNDRSPTGSNDEYFSNFKHKAAIRLSILIEGKGEFVEALTILTLAESKYPLQHTDLEKNLRNKDHFLVLENKLRLLNKTGNHYEFLKTSLNESFSKEFSEIPLKISRNISEIITKNTGKSNFINSYESAIESLKIESKNGKSIITFNIDELDYNITTKNLINKSEAQKTLRELPFYTILKS